MIIIHGASMSPFVRKTLVIATEKGIEFEHKVGVFGQPTDDFLAASPFRKIPALTDGDFCISDSSAIIHYLEAIQPEPAMIPSEAKSRARTIWYEEFGDTIVCAAGGTIFFNRVVAPKFLGRPGDDSAAEKAEREGLPPVYDYLEGVVPASGYLVDDRFTLADAAVASPFVNLAHVGIRPDPGAHPKLTAYLAGILGRPSFARYVDGERRFLARAA